MITTVELKLSPLHLEILKILDRWEPWLTTGEIGLNISGDAIRAHYGRRQGDAICHRRISYISSGLPVMLGSMRQKGLVQRRPGPSRKRGRCSEWSLGPVSDLLKEEGRL